MSGNGGLGIGRLKKLTFLLDFLNSSLEKFGIRGGARGSIGVRVEGGGGEKI